MKEITPKEAHKLGMKILQKYEKEWEVYTKREAKELESMSD